MQKQTSQWFIPLFLAIGAAVALWYYWLRVSEPEPERVSAPVIAPAPETPTGPAHPVEQTTPAERADAELVPLPALDESDEYFRLELDNLFTPAVDEMLVESGLIEKFVATVDNLPRSRVAERIRPVGRLASSFVADGQDESGEYAISSDNYSRYDNVVAMLVAADMDQAIEVYRRYYPLFQRAYVNLGYPDGYFNDRLVEVVDHLLATPEVEGPIALVRPHVNFEYDDPALEALSGGQKLLIRMGPENSARVRAKLQTLRSRLVVL